LEYTASDGKIYQTGFYNLDAILSVGYKKLFAFSKMEIKPNEIFKTEK